MCWPPVPPPYLHCTFPLRQHVQKSREREETVTRIQMTTGRSRERNVEGRWLLYKVMGRINVHSFHDPISAQKLRTDSYLLFI
jgi:hypothetical protein